MFNCKFVKGSGYPVGLTAYIGKFSQYSQIEKIQDLDILGGNLKFDGVVSEDYGNIKKSRQHFTLGSSMLGIDPFNISSGGMTVSNDLGEGSIFIEVHTSINEDLSELHLLFDMENDNYPKKITRYMAYEGAFTMYLPIQVFTLDSPYRVIDASNLSDIEDSVTLLVLSDFNKPNLPITIKAMSPRLFVDISTDEGLNYFTASNQLGDQSSILSSIVLDSGKVSIIDRTQSIKQYIDMEMFYFGDTVEVYNNSNKVYSGIIEDIVIDYENIHSFEISLESDVFINSTSDTSFFYNDYDSRTVFNTILAGSGLKVESSTYINNYIPSYTITGLKGTYNNLTMLQHFLLVSGCFAYIDLDNYLRFIKIENLDNGTPKMGISPSRLLEISTMSKKRDAQVNHLTINHDVVTGGETVSFTYPIFKGTYNTSISEYTMTELVSNGNNVNNIFSALSFREGYGYNSSVAEYTSIYNYFINKDTFNLTESEYYDILNNYNVKDTVPLNLVISSESYRYYLYTNVSSAVAPSLQNNTESTSSYVVSNLKSLMENGSQMVLNGSNFMSRFTHRATSGTSSHPMEYRAAINATFSMYNYKVEGTSSTIVISSSKIETETIDVPIYRNENTLRDNLTSTVEYFNEGRNVLTIKHVIVNNKYFEVGDIIDLSDLNINSNFKSKYVIIKETKSFDGLFTQELTLSKKGR